MKHTVIYSALIGIVMSLSFDQASAQPPRAAAEVINTLDDWNAEDGYVVVGGRRYPVNGQIDVVDRNGEPLTMDALRRGVSVGILEENGRVTKLVVFDN